jgi:hypothetical protein
MDRVAILPGALHSGIVEKPEQLSDIKEGTNLHIYPFSGD